MKPFPFKKKLYMKFFSGKKNKVFAFKVPFNNKCFHDFLHYLMA